MGCFLAILLQIRIFHQHQKARHVINRYQMNVTFCFVEVYRQNKTLSSSCFSNTVYAVKHKNQNMELCNILHASNSMSDTYQYSIYYILLILTLMWKKAPFWLFWRRAWFTILMNLKMKWTAWPTLWYYRFKQISISPNVKMASILF
jgi:hypothetical protein